MTTRRAASVAALTLVLAVSLYARAAAASTAQIGDPVTDTVQLWTAIAALFEGAAHQLAIALEHQQSVASAGIETGAQPANAGLATEQPATIPSIAPTPISKTSARGSSTTAPIIERIVEYEPLASDGSITQAELTAQLQQLSNSLTAKFTVPTTAPIPQSVAADGNNENPFAAVNAINNLSNVTITNANLTASEIPSLDYLSLSGGSLAGNLLVNGSATTTGTSYFTGNVGIGTSTSQDALALNGSTFLANTTAPAITTNRLYANSGSLYWAGNLIAGAATGNWTSDGTNVWRTGGNVGIGTTTPGSILSIQGVGNFVGNATSTLYNGLNVAALNVTGSATTKGTVVFSGVTSAPASVQLSATNNSNVTYPASMYGLLETNTFVPTGTPGFVFGAYLQPTINTYSGSSIFSFAAENTDPILGSNFTGSLTNVFDYEGGDIINNSSFVVPHFYQALMLGTNNGNGTTSGLVDNRDYSAGNSTAGAGLGGIINNYSYFADVPTGSGAGTTNNYGLYITDNGGSGGAGTTNNYSIYNNSTSTSYFAGNIGVNTAAPSSLLDLKSSALGIAGGIRLDQNSGTNRVADLYEISPGEGDLSLFNADTENVKLRANGSSYFNSGNVGIGTTTPTALLTLDSSSPNGTTMRVSNSSVGGHIYDWLSTGSGNTGGAGRLDLFDYTAGAARLSVASNGNVGIGTTTPGSIFSIAGVANLTSATSTYYSTGGINLDAGCFAVAGNCLGLANLSGILGIGQGGTGATSATGATTNLQFLNPASGAVARSLTSKLADMLNVKDFGATGNGVTDDTSAIQAALNVASSTGMTAYFPAGIYEISSPLQVGGSVYMDTNATIQATQSMAAVMEEGSNGYTYNGTIQGGTLDANNLATDGLFMRSYRNWRITNIRVLNQINDAIHLGDQSLVGANGYSFGAQITNVITDRTIDTQGASSTGIFQDAATDSIIDGANLISDDIGLETLTGNNFYSHIHVYSHTSTGTTTIAFEDMGTGNHWDDDEADTVGEYGILVHLSGTVIENCSFYNNTTSGLNGVVDAIHFDESTPTATIVNNVFDGASANNQFLKDVEVSSLVNIQSYGNQEINVETQYLGSVNAQAGFNYQMGGIVVLNASSTLFNTEVGLNAAPSITTGTGDTATGYDALQYATSSSNDSAYGYEACLGSNVLKDGGNNACFGASTLQRLTTGGSNSAFGQNAGADISTGFSNTLLGQGALANVTGGSSNVAVGRLALNVLNGSSADNTAVGHEAGNGNGGSAFVGTGGSYFGYETGFNIQSGSDYNTLLGFQSGYNVTTGWGNVLIGAASTTANGNLTTGSNNIAIGNNISLPSATANGQLDIGNLLYGTGLMGTGNKLSAGNIGIGTTTPYSTLTVWGTNTAAGTYPFLIANSASTTEFGVDDAGNATIGGTLALSGIAGTTTIASGQGFTIGSTQFVLQQGSGNVGLNTNTPAALLDLKSSGTTIAGGLRLDQNSGTNRVADLYEISTGEGDLSLFYSGIENVKLRANAASFIDGGNLGVGTSTPYSRLEVWGSDTSGNTSSFVIANSASTTEFNVLDNGNAILAGTLTQNSDQRLKTNIQSLNASSSLSMIDQLNPVTFNWIDPSESSTTQLGFIAQQVQPIFPNLVSTTSPTALTPGGTLSLNYIDLISPIVSAIQALSTDITSIENTIAGFAQSFTTNELSFNRATGQQLCLLESDGTSVCVTGDQLAAVLASENQSPADSSSASSDSNTASSTTDTPPVISINGDNPAIVQVGASYNDLGATITGPQADLNLGIATFLNGTLTSNIVIDTSAAATDSIDYVATDQSGLTSTSTRTVIIQAATSSPSI